MTAVVNADGPQLSPWVDAIRTLRVCDVRRRWPTVEALTKVRPAPLARFVHAPHAGRREPISCRMAAIKEAVPLPTDQAVMPSSVLMIKAFATPMKTTIAALRACEHALAPRWSTPEDYHPCASLPGAGTVSAARLTAAVGTVRDRGTTVEELRCFSGVAPVLERRGQSTGRRWRDVCPTFLRQSFHEDAGEPINHSFGASA
jgi:hypothetical protein